MTSGEIVNRVASSSLITLDIESLYDYQTPRVSFDLADYMHRGLILRESEFRSTLSQKSWDEFASAIVGIHCSTESIIPQWAYLLISVYLHSVAKFVGFGTEIQVNEQFLLHRISSMNVEEYRDKKVIVKGCSRSEVPLNAYTLLSFRLTGVVSSLMYGEPCSTVPLYKKAKV